MPIDGHAVREIVNVVYIYTYMYLLDGNAIKVVNCSSYCAAYLRVHVRKSEAMRWPVVVQRLRLPTKCARTRSPRARAIAETKAYDLEPVAG